MLQSAVTRTEKSEGHDVVLWYVGTVMLYPGRRLALGRGGNGLLLFCRIDFVDPTTNCFVSSNSTRLSTNSLRRKGSAWEWGIDHAILFASESGSLPIVNMVRSILAIFSFDNFCFCCTCLCRIFVYQGHPLRTPGIFRAAGLATAALFLPKSPGGRMKDLLGVVGGATRIYLWCFVVWISIPVHWYVPYVLFVVSPENSAFFTVSSPLFCSDTLQQKGLLK